MVFTDEDKFFFKFVFKEVRSKEVDRRINFLKTAGQSMVLIVSSQSHLVTTPVCDNKAGTPQYRKYTDKTLKPHINFYHIYEMKMQ